MNENRQFDEENKKTTEDIYDGLQDGTIHLDEEMLLAEEVAQSTNFIEEDLLQVQRDLDLIFKNL